MIFTPFILLYSIIVCKMKHTQPQNNHYVIMFIIMVLSGLLSTMNVWVDKADDVRFSINDAYMTLLMTGWMFLFMGLIYKETSVFFIGLLLILFNIWCIRNQFLVSETQYKMGMIPHHSMAVHMSKKLLEKENNISRFVKDIIKNQENEIIILKK
jgi:phosphatidylserine synthase